MSISNACPSGCSVLLDAINIKTPDHLYGWVIILDGTTTVRVAMRGSHVLEQRIIEDAPENQRSISEEAWLMVTRTLDLTGPRDTYKIDSLQTMIPQSLADRVISADTDLERHNVISELALFIGIEKAAGELTH